MAQKIKSKPALTSIVGCLALALAAMACLPAQTQAREVDRSTVEVGFDGNGLGSLVVDGTDLLASGEPVVRKVVLADGYRNRNEEPDATMYHPDTRTFRDSRTIPFEVFFEPMAHEVSQLHEWGRLTVGYAGGDGHLDFTVTVENTGDDTIEYIELDLAKLELPGEVQSRLVSSIPGFMRSNANLEGPDVRITDFGGGRLVFASRTFEVPMVQQVVARDGAQVVSLAVGSPDGGREVLDKLWNVHPIASGETARFELTLRFVPEGTDPFAAVADVLEAYGESVPMVMEWPDRRPIVSVHVADGRRNASNPRGWKQTVGLPDDWHILEDEDHAVFRAAVLRGAENVVRVARRSGAQGAIVWQIEGMQEVGHAYYGEPRILPYVAPEMDAIADEFFGIMRDAGLRVGVTLRPLIQAPFDPEEGGDSGALEGVVDWEQMREAAKRADWSIQFRNLSWQGSIPEPLRDFYDADEAWSMLARLDNKIRYAKERWGATLFYLDANSAYRPRVRGETMGSWSGRPIAARVVEELQRRHPDCQIISEHQNFRYWTSGAQYIQPPVFGQSVTPREVRMAYPDAMSVLASVGPASVFLSEGQYRRFLPAVINGDTFLTHGWFGGDFPLLDALFGPAAMQAPFKIRVLEDGIEANGEVFSDVAALRDWLEERMPATRAIRPRRAFVRALPSVPLDEITAVHEAVFAAGGILAWSVVEEDGHPGFWNDSAVKVEVERAYAQRFSDPGDGALRLLIGNAADEDRIVSVRLDVARLGIGVREADDVIVAHLESIFQTERVDPPSLQDMDSRLMDERGSGDRDDLMDSLIAGLDREEQRASQRESFEFDLENHWYEDGVLQIKIPAEGFRSVQLRRLR